MKIRPYITFDGECSEAIALYKRAFQADTDRVLCFSNLPPNPQWQIPVEYANQIVQATLKFGDDFVRLSDLGPQHKEDLSGNGRISLTFEASVDAVKHAFSVLSESGTVTMELAETFYSPCAGGSIVIMSMRGGDGENVVRGNSIKYLNFCHIGA